MAKPIKETPFLRGKDAIDFVRNNEEVKKASQEEREKIKKGYDALRSIAEFA
ncbi:hypothetical protein [Arenibacter algicola]|uniref:Uncharacterized protein n=1 Tax=Arenibacter algicola TaxID=616991 RepID=A0A221V3Z8_9FLAO|nr:hypothetical protein [Arenibacter algicola]ASO08305.1 hypothetical protein AREALGSMS7_04930 [Arenibacter algicola]